MKQCTPPKSRDETIHSEVGHRIPRLCEPHGLIADTITKPNVGY